ncbi:MAG: hypothetical protein HC867_03180 [Bacteroidia bacterium]|nr:hypothetical protein [Bacteroidia bacterium]
MQEILYNEFKPAAALGDYIKCYWVLEGPAATGSAERVFPDGSMEMIFHYGDVFHYANEKENDPAAPCILIRSAKSLY